MIAEIHGKISNSGSNLSERLEDQLTGNVFGALRYLQSRLVLQPFLQKAYNLNGVQRFLDLSFSANNEPTIDFWTHDYEGIEPDVRIRITAPNPAVIFVEVKYHSGLSGEDATHSEVSFSNSQNQLIRQIKALRRYHPAHRKILVFLSTDQTYPNLLIDYVQDVLRKNAIEDVELYWLCWNEISHVIDEARSQVVDRFTYTLLDDLLSYCHDRKGFTKFTGFSSLVLRPSRGWQFVETLDLSSGTPRGSFVATFCLVSADSPPTARPFCCSFHLDPVSEVSRIFADEGG